MALPQLIKDLLESGVHFGHLSKHWNPKMKKFIFGKKKNVYIIDLEKTAQRLEAARNFVKEIAMRDEKVLFVATKRQLRDLVQEMAISCGMPYIVERWVGGFLTNFPTIHKRVKRYVDLIEKRTNGELENMPRKELVRLNRQLERMERNYSGVKDLNTLPGCVFVIDPKKEVACVREAARLSIPVVALIDTDADPDDVDYPIPGNDDAIKSVRCIIANVVEGVKEGTTAKETAAEALKAEAAAKLKKLAGDDKINVSEEVIEAIAEEAEGKEKEKE